MELSQNCFLITRTLDSTDYFHCQFSLNDRTAESRKRLCRTLDVLIRTTNDQIPPSSLLEVQAGSKPKLYVYAPSTSSGSSVDPETLLPAAFVAQEFILGCIEAARTGCAGQESLIAIKFILPDTDGYTVRSDFLERRLDGCLLTAKVVGFLSPLQEVKSAFSNKAGPITFASLVSSAIGGILVHDPQGKFEVTTLRMLDAELDNRISFPWVVSEPISRKRLAWVEGRRDIEVSKRMYEAAWALGITIVMIDNPGHWLEDDKGPNAHLREAFIPLSIAVDEGFVQRIVDAVKSYNKPIDGIMTVSDARVISVSKACEILGLPTSPSDAYILAADKYKTRMMEPTKYGAFQVSSVSELRERLDSKTPPPLSYPLIVKPSVGWGSECVSKVSNEAQLSCAVEKAANRHASSPQRLTKVVIEPYIDGPEVDANFVLLNKEIVFFEISDDFPSRGDATTATSADNFLEGQIVLPSNLPADEIAKVRNSIHQSILRQGFVSGTFHCEARIQHSAVHYTTKDGHFDLYLKQDQANRREPKVYLLEINARPAGYQETVAVHLTYGVDYFAQQLLFSIGSVVRFRALAIPFCNGPQYTCLIQFVPQQRAGIMKSDDPGLQLYKSCPELMANVPEHKTWIKKGDVLKGPEASELLWLAQFLVVSREGRMAVLELGNKIESNFQYELEE